MSQRKTEKYILDGIARDGALLFVLIDPVDYPSVEDAVKTASEAADAGADLILIGGSIGVQGVLLDEATKRIKEKVKVPVVLFPGNIATVTKNADALYFMSLMNSRNPYWISQAQTLAAPVIKKLGIEPLPVAYIIVEPGGTVGWVGDANVVPRAKPQICAALALAGQYSGAHFVLTDVGSASKVGPVPVEMVAAVAKTIDVPYIVAGGIRTPKEAGDIIAAGADAVQIGTVAEKSSDVRKTISEFVKAVKEEGRKKKR
ncbi:Geranylgeranylglyceryl phosphate synthase [Candidatus Gugararchaeum adminiculabundum]|nr:Geranylgeranylglyceryl phosphate synthase [Candidatus Gugararchaeum adminiculabundum]